MTVPVFDPERSAAIRDALSDRVRDARVDDRRRLSRWVGRIGIGAAGVVAGAAISGGAWASGWIERPDLEEPISSLAGADGVIPGAPVVTLLGEPVSRTIDGTAAIDLADRPDDATHVRLRVACLAAGTVSFGFDPSNTASMTCGPGDIGEVAWTDLELPSEPVLHVVAAPEMRTLVDYEFAIVRGTPWATNPAGESYGTSNESGSPELVAVVGWDDEGRMVEGYAREVDIAYVGYPEPQNPDEAAAYMDYIAQLRVQYPDGYPVPVYKSDGVTRIGSFYVSLG